MSQLALHCSSFVGKHFGYHPNNEWGACVKACSDYYQPLETFAGRFEQLVLTVKALGFSAMDLWQPGQLNWQWAQKEHVAAVKETLAKHGMMLTSYAGEFGETRPEMIKACEIASGIGAPILSGMLDLLYTDRDFVLGTLKEYGLKLALENHPETSAVEMLAKLGPAPSPVLGTAIDTGWYATRGYDVLKAIEVLQGRILHIHLKDVLPGPEHVNCAYGKGMVPIEACVRALKNAGFKGVYSVEEHVVDHDPVDELRQGGLKVRRWLAE